MVSSVTLPFVTETDYARQVGARQDVLYEAQRVEACAPIVFPKTEADYFGRDPLRYDFPAVTLTTFRDVVVRGRSNILTGREAVVRHGLIDMSADLTPEEFYSRLGVSPNQESAEWAANDPFKVGYLPEAAVFADAVSFNYAHWITEVLPRIAALTRGGKGPPPPLIVDARLHANIRRSIDLIAGPDAVVHQLTPNELVRVGVLHNVSPAGYVPFKIRPNTPDPIGHGLFSPRALRRLVDCLRRAAGANEAVGARPKLFIRRNSSVRRLINEAEIEQALVGLGFVVVEPERLSLEEQVAAYSSAGMILGATGAAMANLIFCRPDCPTVVLMPKFRHTGYWYWRRMAAAAGAGTVVHVSGEQLTPTSDPYHALAVHQDFQVEVKAVLDAVEAAQALSG